MKTEDDFVRELATYYERLKSQGREVRPADMSGPQPDSLVRGDFDQPYSSMPPLQGTRWKKTELFAC